MNGCLMTDQLTEKELSELKLLINNEEEITQFALKRTEDKTLKGMYMSLWKKEYLQGVSYTNNEFYVKRLNPSAYWAVEKARIEKEEEVKKLEESKRQRRFDRFFSIGSVLFGWILGIFTPVLTAFVSTVLS